MCVCVCVYVCVCVCVCVCMRACVCVCIRVRKEWGMDLRWSQANWDDDLFEEPSTREGFGRRVMAGVSLSSCLAGACEVTAAPHSIPGILKGGLRLRISDCVG
jgi:hypothetical protein